MFFLQTQLLVHSIIIVLVYILFEYPTAVHPAIHQHVCTLNTEQCGKAKPICISSQWLYSGLCIECSFVHLNVEKGKYMPQLLSKYYCTHSLLFQYQSEIHRILREYMIQVNVLHLSSKLAGINEYTHRGSYKNKKGTYCTQKISKLGSCNIISVLNADMYTLVCSSLVRSMLGEHACLHTCASLC